MVQRGVRQDHRRHTPLKYMASPMNLRTWFLENAGPDGLALMARNVPKIPRYLFLGEHDGYGTPEYNSWRSIVQRCLNPKCKAYRDYGARGISMCLLWRLSFSAFLEDVGPRPGLGYSLDRIDNEGNYEPGNVRWATPTEQCRNRRGNRIIEYNGERLTLSEWANKFGIRQATLWGRLRDGWSVEAALRTPVRKWRLPA
jgi:hypothetical protein